MSWKLKFLLSCPVFTVSLLSAATEKLIDEKKPIAILFSNSSHNRISVEGGAVEKVIGDSSLFSVTIDRTTGNAFINLLKETTQPTTLTVVTSSGLVQDLLVSSKEGLSEQLILSEDEESDWDNEMLRATLVQGATTVEMLNKILEGKVPFGYGQRPLEKNEQLELPAPLQTESLKAFEGPLDTIFVYQIKNQGLQPIVVTSDALKRETHSWVFLNVQDLAPRQEAICIISYPKDRS
jgi:hypothetical protein